MFHLCVCRRDSRAAATPATKMIPVCTRCTLCSKLGWGLGWQPRLVVFGILFWCSISACVEKQGSSLPDHELFQCAHVLYSVFLTRLRAQAGGLVSCPGVPSELMSASGPLVHASGSESLAGAVAFLT